MKKVCIFLAKENALQYNSIFKHPSWLVLKERLQKLNIDLATPKEYPVNEADIVIYILMPKVLPKNKEKSFLILGESEVFAPQDYISEYHMAFSKVFTWKDELVDNEKFIRLFSSVRQSNQSQTTDPQLELWH